jgi:hypothetical protein
MEEQVANRFTSFPANFNSDLSYEPKKDRKEKRENKQTPTTRKKVTAFIKPETFVKKNDGVPIEFTFLFMAI